MAPGHLLDRLLLHQCRRGRPGRQPKAGPPAAHSSQAQIAAVPGPFLWRRRDEIKREPDKELRSRAIRSYESLGAMWAKPAQARAIGLAMPGEPSFHRRRGLDTGPSVFTANKNDSAQLCGAGDELGAGRVCVPWPPERPAPMPRPSWPCALLAKGGGPRR